MYEVKKKTVLQLYIVCPFFLLFFWINVSITAFPYCFYHNTLHTFTLLSNVQSLKCFINKNVFKHLVSVVDILFVRPMNKNRVHTFNNMEKLMRKMCFSLALEQICFLVWTDIGKTKENNIYLLVAYLPQDISQNGMLDTDSYAKHRLCIFHLLYMCIPNFYWKIEKKRNI